jgi:RHS repeat-associated protein
MKLARLLCVPVFICAFNGLLFTQSSPSLENGFKNYGSYDGSSLDTVNVMNGNLMLHIPVLPVLPQRGAFAPRYSLYVTSKAWQTRCKPNSNSSTGQTCWWDTNNPGVMLINAEGLLARRTLVKTFSGTGQTLYATQQYSVTAPDGSVHQFAPVPNQPLDANSDPTVFETLDTSGYHLIVSNPDTNGVMNNVTVINRSGIQYSGVFSTYADFHSCYDPGQTVGYALSGYKTIIDGSPAGDGFCPQAAYATLATDPNGNQMNFWSTNISSTPPQLTTDTLGRSVPFTFTPANAGTPDLTKCVSVSGRTIISADLLYYNAPDGTTQQIQRCWANTPIQTAFGVPNFIEAPSINSSIPQGQLPQLVTLVLADGSKWTFDYDSYGDVIYVGLPTGGNLAYTWTTIYIPAPFGSTGWSRAVKTRTLVADSTQSSQWTYNWSSNVITLTNAVTDPSGNDTVHVFTALDGMTSFYETSTQYFLGTKGGQPFKQVDTTYAPYASLTENSLTANIVPINIKTTLNPSGKVSLVTREYDKGFGTIDSPIFGNVTKQFEYDWGQGAPGALLLRETDTTYQWQVDSRYLDAHLIDLAATVVIKDGSGCALAQTDYKYDEAGYLTGTTVSTQHVAAPNPSPVRGNLTTVKHWLAPTSSCNPAGGTAVASHTNWYDTGEPYQKTDPLGHITTLSYDSAYASAYVTQTCSPQTGSVKHCVSGTYDFNTGVLTSLTSENAPSQASGNTQNDGPYISSFGYDSMFRIKSATAPPDPANGDNRAQTSFNFSTPNVFPLSVQRTKSITGAVSDSATNYFDGLGRVTNGQHVLPGGTANVDTQFDLDGHVWKVSNPYFSTSDPTYGNTTNLYDALDRVTQTTKQDGSVSKVSYDQAAPGVAGVCTVSTDEAGNQRRGCADALGRLTEVDEPNPGSQPVPAQGTVSISGTLRSQSGVGAIGSATATAQVTIGGSDGSHSVVPTCTAQQIRTGTCDQTPEWFNDTGTVHITINGHEYDYAFGNGSSPDIQSTVAQGLVNAIQADASRVVNASISASAQNVVVLTALNAGAAGNNIAYSTGSTLDFTISPASGNLAGGVDLYPGVTVYDKGTVSLSVGGFTAQACYGRSGDCAAPPAGCTTGDSTATQLACILASGLNASGSPVTASYSGSSLTLTYKTAGASGNGVTLTSSAQSTQTAYSFSPISFCAPPGCNGTMANGLDALDLNNNPFVTQYQYDGLGNLLRVDQKGTSPNDSTQWRTRTFTYDTLSRLLTANNPESGTITYSYDLDGNLLQKTSPAPNQTGTATQTVSYCYDEQHRVTAKGYGVQTCPLATPVISYVYDSGTNAIGHLTSLTDQAGTASYTYDILGRLSAETRTLTGANNASISKNLSYEYNLDGSLYKLHYPSGSVVTYEPGAAGLTLSAKDTGNNINYATSATYGPDSALTGFISGYNTGFAGITNAFNYNKRLQPIKMSADAPSQTVFSIGYDFHVGNGTTGADNGNVFGITNYKDNTRSQTFTYDSLNRLSSAQNAGTDCTVNVIGGNKKFWGNTYTYDAWGNLVNKTKIGTACAGENLSLTADAHNWIHATGGSDYQYDSAGNMTFNATPPTQTYTYDQENRLTGAAGYAYTYDGDGNRVRKSNSSSTGTLYWYMAPGIVGESDLSGNLTDEYIFFDGERVARKSTNGVFYYFSDHLKTASVITDSAGIIKAESDYYPWGGELQFVANDSNHYKFTGKERDSETQLDYFGARYYSNGLGRWVSADWSAAPVPVPYASFGDPQSLNQYSYVRNIPTVNVDTDGHETLNSVTNDRGNTGMVPCATEQCRDFDEKMGDFILNGFAMVTGPLGRAFFAAEAIADWRSGNKTSAVMGALAVVPGEKLVGSVWKLGNFARGIAIETALGKNLASGFPVIDRFLNGTATSIKSIDLTAKTYQDTEKLAGTLEKYVDKVSNFNGATYGNQTVKGSDIAARELQVAIPKGSMSAAQQKVFDTAAARAANLKNPVKLTVTQVQ